MPTQLKNRNVFQDDLQYKYLFTSLGFSLNDAFFSLTIVMLDFIIHLVDQILAIWNRFEINAMLILEKIIKKNKLLRITN